MPDDLKLLDIQLSPPRPDPEPHPETGDRQQWVDATIKVRNTSDSRTCHMVSTLRSFRYDPAARKLELGFREPELMPGVSPASFVAPEITPVGPGETVEVKVSVPLVLQELRPSSGKGIAFESIDVSDVSEVRCRLCFADAPPYFRSSASPKEMMDDLRKWGQEVSKTFERSIERPKGGKKKPRKRGKPKKQKPRKPRKSE